MLLRIFSRVAAASWYSPRHSWNGDGSGEAVCVRISSNRDTGDITSLRSAESSAVALVPPVSPTEPPAPGPLLSVDHFPEASCAS